MGQVVLLNVALATADVAALYASQRDRFSAYGVAYPGATPSSAVSMAPLRAFSVRRLFASYAADMPLVSVRNGGTGAQADFFGRTAVVPGNGRVAWDLVALDGTTLAAWLGGSTGYVVTWCARCWLGGGSVLAPACVPCPAVCVRGYPSAAPRPAGGLLPAGQSATEARAARRTAVCAADHRAAIAASTHAGWL